MDNPEAAHILNVSEADVRDVKVEAGWWHALKHNMVDHSEEWVKVAKASVEEFIPTTQAVDDQAPPSGSVQEVVDWVGDDPVRAQAALDVENAKDSPRVTLVTALEKLVSD